MSKNSLKNIILLWSATVIWWVLNYAYHPLMLHFLSIQEFWEFESLISMFSMLWVFTSWFMLYVNKEVSQLGNDKTNLVRLYVSSVTFFGAIWVLVYLVYLLFVPYLADYLNIDNTILIGMVWISIIFSFLAMPMDATMRGLHKFWDKSKVMLWTPLFKLCLGVFAVFMGYGLFGAVGAFIVTWAVSIGISIYLLHKYVVFDNSLRDIPRLMKDMRWLKGEVFHFFVASALFAFFMNADILIAKNLFDAYTVWLYAWISVLAKFLLFLLMSIETVYYSQAMEAAKEYIPDHLITNPVALALGATLIAYVWERFVWWFVLWILNAELVQYLPLLSLLILYNWLLAVVSYVSKILVWSWSVVWNIVFAMMAWVLVLILYQWWILSLEAYVSTFLMVMCVTTVLLMLVLQRQRRWSEDGAVIETD